MANIQYLALAQPLGTVHLEALFLWSHRLDPLLGLEVTDACTCSVYQRACKSLSDHADAYGQVYTVIVAFRQLLLLHGAVKQEVGGQGLIALTEQECLDAAVSVKAQSLQAPNCCLFLLCQVHCHCTWGQACIHNIKPS